MGRNDQNVARENRQLDKKSLEFYDEEKSARYDGYAKRYNICYFVDLLAKSKTTILQGSKMDHFLKM